METSGSNTSRCNMANYYYDIYSLAFSHSPVPSWKDSTEWVTSKTLVWNSFEWDYATSRYVGVTSLGERSPGELWLKHYVHANGEYVKSYYSVLENSGSSTRYAILTRYRRSSTHKGNLLESNMVLDDMYPINGSKGGLWYVRKGPEIPELGMRINV